MEEKRKKKKKATVTKFHDENRTFRDKAHERELELNKSIHNLSIEIDERMGNLAKENSERIWHFQQMYPESTYQMHFVLSIILVFWGAIFVIIVRIDAKFANMDAKILKIEKNVP